MKNYLTLAVLLIPTAALCQTNNISIYNDTQQNQYFIVGPGITNGYSGCLNINSSAGFQVTVKTPTPVFIYSSQKCSNTYSGNPIHNFVYKPGNSYKFWCNGSTCQQTASAATSKKTFIPVTKGKR